MLDSGHEQSRRTLNLDPRMEENLELACEDGITFFAVGRCKNYDKFGCAAFIRKFDTFKTLLPRELYLLLNCKFTRIVRTNLFLLR